MTIIVKDLEFNIELDRKAMASLLGGWKNQTASTSYSKFANSSGIRWANTGARSPRPSPLNLYQTKV